MSNPNSFDEEIKDVQDGANDIPEGTDQKETENPGDPATDPAEIDYKDKFTESAKEGIRLAKLDTENKAEIDRLNAELAKKGDDLTTQTHETENLYPGFEELDQDAQDNLIKYTDAVTNRAQEQMQKDPAIAFAREQYAKNTWDSAFNTIQGQYPDLKDSAEDFKAKYFDSANVPENIEEILGDLAKIYLFDKSKDIGAEEQKQLDERVELEENTGGDNGPTTSRTLSDWQRMAQNNPVEFAANREQYDKDLASGTLKE